MHKCLPAINASPQLDSGRQWQIDLSAVDGNAVLRDLNQNLYYCSLLSRKGKEKDNQEEKEDEAGEVGGGGEWTNEEGEVHQKP